MKKILFAIAAILLMFGTAQAGPFVSGAGGGGGGNTLWGLALEQPDAADDGKYIQYQNASTSWILSTPAGGGDMTIAVWDGDANGFIDLDAGGTNTTLADPGADRIMFWDDSGTVMNWLQLDTGLSITLTTLSLDAELVAFVGLTSAANTLPYYTGSGTAALTDFSAVGRGIVQSGTTTIARAALGVVIGTDVQAYDADLAALAGLTSAADKLPYFTGGGTASTTDLSAVGRGIIQSGTTTIARASLGLAIGTNVQAYDAELAALAGLTSAANKLPYFTGSETAAVTDLSAVGMGIIQSGTTGAARVAIGVAYGSGSANFAFTNGDLIDMSGVTMTAGVDEGIAIPWWVDVAPATEKFYLAYDPSGNALYVREAGGWVNVGASAAAPTTAHYVVTAASGNLTEESVLAEGLAIDISDAGGDGGNVTIAFDPTELTGDRTWAAGGAATIAWTWDVSVGTDPVITFGNNYVNISTGKLLSGNTDVYVSGATDVYVTDGGTGKSSWTQWGIVYADTDVSFSQVASGTSGQLLRSQGSAAPVWTSALYPNAGGTSGNFIKSDGTNFVSAAHGLSMDDIADGSTYQKVAATDVDGANHVNLIQDIDGVGAITITGPSATRAITIDDAAQELAARNRANTFTENNTFGTADTDTLTIRSRIIGGNSRQVNIDDDDTSAPTYATGTNELFVEGDIETAGDVYAASFHMADGIDGSRGITLTSNMALTPTVNQIYFINDVLYFSQAGTQKTPMRLEDAQTATGKKTFQGDIAVGDASNAGSIDIYDGSNNMWTVQTGALSGDLVLVLPTAAGTTGQYLKTTTVGSTATLSWDTPSASADTTGGTGGVQFNAAGVLTSDLGFVFTTASDKLSLGYSGGATTGTLDLYYTGTTYAATISPNASMSGDVTITLPSYTTTLLGGGANTFTGQQRFTSGVTVDGVVFLNSDIFPGNASVDLGSSVSPFATISLGANPASSTGTIKMSKGSSIMARNISDDQDLTIIQTDTLHNGITIGEDSGYVSGVTVYPSTRFQNGILSGGVLPLSADASNLGSSSAEWANLYLGDGAVIYFQNDQSVYLTASAGKLTLTGSFTASGVTTQSLFVADNIYPSQANTYALGSGTSNFADLFLGDGAVISFNNGDATITHSTNRLTFGGASTGYNFDSGVTVQNVLFVAGDIYPSQADTYNLGSGTSEFANLYLGDSAVIYGENDSSNTITSSAAGWTFAKDIIVTGADITLISATAGSKITGGDGTVTLTGTGSGTDEDLKIDLNTYSNVAYINSGTATHTIGFSGVGLDLSGVSLVMPVGAAPTVIAKAGAFALDTTASQLVSNNGTAEIVLSGVTKDEKITVSGVTDVADRDDHFLGAALSQNITVKEINAVLRRNDGGRAPTINIQRCTDPATCSDLLAADWVLSGSTAQILYKSAAADFAISQVARRSILKLDVVSGCTDSDLSVTVVYTIDRE